VCELCKCAEVVIFIHRGIFFKLVINGGYYRHDCRVPHFWHCGHDRAL